ncbi:MAG: hypothetical protein RJQ09_05500 [Cyclobacteriaceae bacterium]
MPAHKSKTQTEVAMEYGITLNPFKKRLQDSDPELAKTLKGKKFILPGQLKRIRKNPEFGDPFEE